MESEGCGVRLLSGPARAIGEEPAVWRSRRQSPLRSRVEHDNVPFPRVVDHKRVTCDQHSIPPSSFGDDESAAGILVWSLARLARPLGKRRRFDRKTAVDRQNTHAGITPLIAKPCAKVTRDKQLSFLGLEGDFPHRRSRHEEPPLRGRALDSIRRGSLEPTRRIACPHPDVSVEQNWN